MLMTAGGNLLGDTADFKQRGLALSVRRQTSPRPVNAPATLHRQLTQRPVDGHSAKSHTGRPVQLPTECDRAAQTPPADYTDVLFHRFVKGAGAERERDEYMREAFLMRKCFPDDN